MFGLKQAPYEMTKTQPLIQKISLQYTPLQLWRGCLHSGKTKAKKALPISFSLLSWKPVWGSENIHCVDICLKLDPDRSTQWIPMTFRINFQLLRLVLNNPRACCQDFPVFFQTTSRQHTGLQLNQNYISERNLEFLPSGLC